jgi:hypothetical protein
MPEDKKYGGMKNPAVLEEHYSVAFPLSGSQVWVNKDMDELRRAECLCYNCGRLNIGGDESRNCPIAGMLYNLCKVVNLTAMVTRCPVFEPKQQSNQ